MRKTLITTIICTLLLLTACTAEDVPDILKANPGPEPVTDAITEGYYTCISSTVDMGNWNERETTQILFDCATNPEKAEYPCYEISTNGQTGAWDESEFRHIKSCNYITDKCFGMFEKDGETYYQLVDISNSTPDSPVTAILVSQNVYDTLVDKWKNSHKQDIADSKDKNVTWSVQIGHGQKMQRGIVNDDPREAAKAVLNDYLNPEGMNDIDLKNRIWMIYGSQIEEARPERSSKGFPDEITVEVVECNEDEATITVAPEQSFTPYDGARVYYYKEDLRIVF